RVEARARALERRVDVHAAREARGDARHGERLEAVDARAALRRVDEARLARERRRDGLEPVEEQLQLRRSAHRAAGPARDLEHALWNRELHAAVGEQGPRTARAARLHEHELVLARELDARVAVEPVLGVEPLREGEVLADEDERIAAEVE